MNDAIAASDVLRWAETLSAIARTGLGFTQSLYEQERFEEVLKVAADIRAAAVDEAESQALYAEWLTTVGKGVAGYVTPTVAVAAIVGNTRGETPRTPRADTGLGLEPGVGAGVGRVVCWPYRRRSPWRRGRRGAGRVAARV